MSETRIPSYGDLTPPIPDVLASESVPQLTLFLGAAVKKPAAGRPAPPPAPVSSSSLYACLKGAGEIDARLVAIAKDFSPRIMRAGPGEVLVDVAGLGRLIGDAGAIARELRRAVHEAGVAAAVAVAGTQTTARVLARAPGACDTGALPIALLRDLETLPPGMGVRDRERPYETLERWGITTLAAFAALPAAELSSRLGRRGVALQRLARGLETRPFVPDADVPRFLERLELEWPIDGLEPLSFVFARLLEPLVAALERADRGAAAVRLELRMTDRSVHERLLQLPAPMREARVLRTLLLLDLESHPPVGLRDPASERLRDPASKRLRDPASEGRPPSHKAPADRRRAIAHAGAGGSEVMIDVVEIEVDPAPSRITQFSLLERAVPSPETVSTLMARLHALVGEARAGSPVVLDSLRPDAFELRAFTAVPAAAAPAVPPRPGTLVLRRQRLPAPIRVNVSNGRPVYVAPSRRGVPSGAIVQAAGPWRTSGGWWPDVLPAKAGSGGLPAKAGSYGDGGWSQAQSGWAQDGLRPDERQGAARPDERQRATRPDERQGAARPDERQRSALSPTGSQPHSGWDRNEWDVALAGGTICRIFQDRTTDRWFLEGTYD
jgi:hypothetical protein